MLGVEVDCSRFSKGLVLLRNKPGRVDELVAVLEDGSTQGNGILV